MAVYIVPNTWEEWQKLILNMTADKVEAALYVIENVLVKSEVKEPSVITDEDGKFVRLEHHDPVDTYEEQKWLIAEGEILLADCQKEPFWSDMGLFEAIPREVKKPYIVAVDAFTGISRQPEAGFGRITSPLPTQLVFSNVYASDNFLDMVWRFTVSKNCEVVSNVPFTRVETWDAGVVPLIALALDGPDTVKAGESAQLTVTCSLNGEPLKEPVSLYLTKVNGYLPVERLKVRTSKTFTMSALGLVTGDEMEVKVGYKFWTNVVSKKIGVV